MKVGSAKSPSDKLSQEMQRKRATELWLLISETGVKLKEIFFFAVCGKLYVAEELISWPKVPMILCIGIEEMEEKSKGPNKYSEKKKTHTGYK